MEGGGGGAIVSIRKMGTVLVYIISRKMHMK